MNLPLPWILTALLLVALPGRAQQSAPPVGEIKGTAWSHTAESRAALVERAQVVLPSQATGGAPYVGPLKDAPGGSGRKVPVVLFLHGSSGLGLAAIGDYQRWLGSLGIASVAPDSFALPDRVTYKSPIDKASYERIHALRAHLQAAGVGCDVHYPEPAHLQPAYAGLGYAPGSLPHTEALAGRILSLPMFPELRRDEVERVAAAVAEGVSR